MNLVKENLSHHYRWSKGMLELEVVLGGICFLTEYKK